MPVNGCLATYWSWSRNRHCGLFLVWTTQGNDIPLLERHRGFVHVLSSAVYRGWSSLKDCRCVWLSLFPLQITKGKLVADLLSFSSTVALSPILRLTHPIPFLSLYFPITGLWLIQNKSGWQPHDTRAMSHVCDLKSTWCFVDGNPRSAVSSRVLMLILSYLAKLKVHLYP